MKVALLNSDKANRDSNVDAVCTSVQEKLAEQFPEQKQKIADALYKLQKKLVRSLILEEHNVWMAEA
jgi:polyribonucleotide nucleotidyltransferase